MPERIGVSPFSRALITRSRSLIGNVKSPSDGMLSSEYDNSEDTRGQILANRGLGTATNVQATFTKGELQSNIRLYDVLKLPANVVLDSSMEFRSPAHLASGQKFDLIRLRRATLELRGRTPTEISEIFAACDREIKSVLIRFDYQDLFGNKQTPVRLAQ